VNGGRRRYQGAASESIGPRLFVAVPLSAEARTVIGDLVAKVRLAPEPAPGERRDPHDVRWVRIDGLHVTLRFLGPTDPGRLAEARAAVQAAADGVGSFGLGLRGAGAFPNASRPRVLWLGLADGLESLDTLTARLARALADRGWPHDDRPTRPHLTLARSDGVGAGPLVAGRLIEAANGFEVGWTADRMVLFESQTGGGPARYVPLLEALLARPGFPRDGAAESR